MDSPEPPVFVQQEAGNVAELVPALIASIAKAKAQLGGSDDAKMASTWRLMSGDRELLAMPQARLRARDHAQSLVPPSRPASGVLPAVGRGGAVGVWTIGGRKSVRRSNRSRSPLNVRLKPDTT